MNRIKNITLCKMYVLERTGKLGCGYQKYRINRIQNQNREDLKIEHQEGDKPLIIVDNTAGAGELSDIILSLSPRQQSTTPGKKRTAVTTPLLDEHCHGTGSVFDHKFQQMDDEKYAHTPLKDV